MERKYVIYTVMTGGYDKILQPLIVDDRFDYVLFSNDFEEKQIGVWQVRSIPVEVDTSDNKRLSRYPKCHPCTTLAEYEASLYIDANLQITDQWVYDRFIELYKQKVLIAGVELQLSGRDCVYEHAYDICNRSIEHDTIALRQCHKMYKRGFPFHYGLNENNVIFRLHNDLVKKVGDDWWWWIVNYSCRDQFSLMYVLWENNISKIYFLPRGEATECSKHFNRINHDLQNRSTKFISLSKTERLRIRCRTLSPKKNKKYLNHWIKICTMPFPSFWNALWGIAVVCFNMPALIYKKIKKFQLS